MREEFGRNGTLASAALAGSDDVSAHQWLLKIPLVRCEDTGVLREEGLEMFERLVQRIGFAANGRGVVAAQKTSQSIESQPQASDDSVDRLQRKRQAQGFRCGFDRRAVEQSE